MKKPLELAFISLAAVIAGLTIIGHTFHHAMFCKWVPWGVAMKEITAWLLLAHAGAAYMLVFPGDRQKYRSSVLVIAALNFFLAWRLALSIGTMENLASYDPRASFFPSVATVGASIILALRLVLVAFDRAHALVAVLGMVCTMIGLSCVVGYLVNQPELYFFVPGVSTAVALPTGAAFAFLGMAVPGAVERRRG